MIDQLTDIMRHTYFKIAAALFIVVPIVWFFIYAFTNLLFVPHGYLMTATIPYPMTISFDKKTYTVKNDHKIPLSPGKYSVVFSADGFDPIYKDIVIKDKEVLHIPIVLNPVTDAAKKEVASAKYNSIKEEITGLQMNDDADELQKKYPLLGQLPIVAPKFSINPCESAASDTKPGICINTASDTYTEYALEELRSSGDDLKKYSISINGVSYSP